MKNKIAMMIINLMMKCQTKVNKTVTIINDVHRIPKMIQVRNRKLMKKKKVPNEWPDHPT